MVEPRNLMALVSMKRMGWVNDLPIPWITSTMEADTTWFLKRWVKLVRSADPSRLLPSISAFYQKQHASSMPDSVIIRKALTRRTKVTTMENDVQRRLQHGRGLEHQGQLLRATDYKAADIWSSTV